MTSSPRCTEPACPVRYRSGPDRPCPLHTDDPNDSMLARMAAFAAMSAAPGEHEGTDGEGEPDGADGSDGQL